MKKVRGVAHSTPSYIARTFAVHKEILAAWKDITPLARNEWICWITSAKKPETRAHRLDRAVAELRQGKRRPCCFAGCPHR